MPAMEFSAVDIAYQKVREAWSAKSSAASEAEMAAQALTAAQARLEAANNSLGPLQDAYLAAVAELKAAIEALAGI